ncbi:uncharacterized protein AAG666_009989 [Megaptera novaeangliae]
MLFCLCDGLRAALLHSLRPDDVHLCIMHSTVGVEVLAEPQTTVCAISALLQFSTHFWHLAGSRGNLKKARSDCMLFRVQLGAAQKFGIVVCRPAGPALPALPLPASLGQPARLSGPGRAARPTRQLVRAGAPRGGADGREAARGRRGAAVRGRAADAATQCCERPGGFTDDAATAGAPPASFPPALALMSCKLLSIHWLVLTVLTTA